MKFCKSCDHVIGQNTGCYCTNCGKYNITKKSVKKVKSEQSSK